jgi:hypothetical protein
MQALGSDHWRQVLGKFQFDLLIVINVHGYLAAVHQPAEQQFVG